MALLEVKTGTIVFDENGMASFELPDGESIVNNPGCRSEPIIRLQKMLIKKLQTF